MHGLNSFVEEYRQRLDFPLGKANVPVLPLERILASKRATNRPKDQLVIPVLEDVLKAKQAKTSG